MVASRECTLMKIIELSEAGKKALEEKQACLIGLSIRNSYFRNEENLKEIYQWASENFSQVFVMIPDSPAIHTLQSLGYPENKARQKAQLASNSLQNKTLAIAEELGIKEKLTIIRWPDLEENIHYLKSLKNLYALYQDNVTFKTDVQEITASVIGGHGTTLNEKDAVEIGVLFILKELAFIANSAEILDVPNCAYVYHRLMPVHKAMLEGKYDMQFPQNSGYIIAEVENENDQLHS